MILRSLFLQFLLFLTLSKVTNGQANDFASQLGYADSLLKVEKYLEAYIEAERLKLFDTSGRFGFESNMISGYALRATGRYSEAKVAFEMAAVAGKNRDESISAEQEILRLLILERKFKKFDDRIAVLEKVFPDKKSAFLHWKGWRFAFEGNWQEAKHHFELSDSSGFLTALCDSAEERSLSLTKGLLLSVLIPGAGQAYAGEYINAALSLGWVAFGVYLVVDALKAERFFDALIEANFVLFRFYRGNISNTIDYINRRNLEIKNENLRFLQFNYRGLKP